MIEIFFGLFLFGLSVVPGIVFWNKDFEPGTIPWRFKNQLRYKNVKARQIEFAEKHSKQRAITASIVNEYEAKTVASEWNMENRLKTDPEHLDWDEKFDAIDRKEREAKEKAEREEEEAKQKAARLADDRRIAEDLRLAREAELEKRRLDEAHNNTFLQSHGWDEEVTYVKATYARINARTSPTLDSPVSFQIQPYQHAPIVGWVYGQQHGDYGNVWYKLAKTGTYVHSAGFETPSAILPDLNEYETETMMSFDGRPVATVRTGVLNNPWGSAPIESITRGGITAEKINAGVITASKISTGSLVLDAGGLKSPNSTSYDIPMKSDYDLKMEEFEEELQAILEEWDTLGKLMEEDPSHEELTYLVHEMTSLVDRRDHLHSQKEQYENDYRKRNREMEQYKESQRKLQRMEQERKRRNEEEETRRRRRREDEDRQRQMNNMNSMNNLAMMVATGII